MPTLSGPVILGIAGVVPAGAEIPATYKDHLGGEYPVDLDRLRALGLVNEDEPKAKVPARQDRDDYDDLSKDELQKRADKRGLKVRGTGADGAVLKHDLVRKLRGG